MKTENNSFGLKLTEPSLRSQWSDTVSPWTPELSDRGFHVGAQEQSRWHRWRVGGYDGLLHHELIITGQNQQTRIPIGSNTGSTQMSPGTDWSSGDGPGDRVAPYLWSATFAANCFVALVTPPWSAADSHASVSQKEAGQKAQPHSGRWRLR